MIANVLYVLSGIFFLLSVAGPIIATPEFCAVASSACIMIFGWAMVFANKK